MFSEDDLNRRKFLKAGGGLVAGGSILSYLGAEQLRDKYDFRKYEGVPEQYIEDPGFYEHIEAEYPDSEVEMLDPADKNLVLDYHVVGDVDSLEGIVNLVEYDFEDIDMEITSLVNQDYEMDWFMDKYGMEAKDILGGGSLMDIAIGGKTTGFWEEQVDDVMKEAAIQVIYLQEPEGYPEDKRITHDFHPLEEVIYDLSGSSAPETSIGISRGDRTAVFVNRKNEYNTNGGYFSDVVDVTKHEVAHSLGLEHKEDTLMAPTLGAGHDFDDQQIETMLEQLS